MEQTPSFEQNLATLEEIVKQLETGDIPLDEALQAFQKGVSLTQELQQKLSQAEELLTTIMTEKGEEPFSIQ